MKRKAEKAPSTAAPRAADAVSAVSAIAARKARLQQQQESSTPVDVPAPSETNAEPPAKKSKSSRTRSPAKQVPATNPEPQSKPPSPPRPDDSTSEEAEVQDHTTEPEGGVVIASAAGEEVDEAIDQGEEGHEVSSRAVVDAENFALSKMRLERSDVVYADKHRICVRIREAMTLTFIGIYDIWVKRGVISLMGAKLAPSPKTYRVYAPSTHSLPVIKCVSGVEGYAEVEISSCTSGLPRLRKLAPVYNRIWNVVGSPGDKEISDEPSQRSFSPLFTSSEDPLKRPLRPLHLDKKWSATIKNLSRRGHELRVLVCGPKGSGKSTFSRYLLNHLLSPAPQMDTSQHQTQDGVAFLDLDPGQSEFAPMGNIYLAHLREPVFGPPFTHPSLENSRHGRIVRAHHIGAPSPRDDPDYYASAAMNLMDHYRMLLATYPQCPLIVNFPGWIFGQGLEIATWLVGCLGLSDVVYMSEKGPDEVVEPLAQAAGSARVALTTLPSQPVDFATRSSAELRAMQIQSYFHQWQPADCPNPVWSDVPLTLVRPITVSYAGPRQGIVGIMVLGNRQDPDMLRDLLAGSIVSVTAIEDPRAITGVSEPADGPDHSGHDEGEEDTSMTEADNPSAASDLHAQLAPFITRSRNESLPYFFVGAGTCTPPNPAATRSLGLALIRSINPSTQKLELLTPIPAEVLRWTLVEQGQGILLVRGQVDAPSWAISEEYYAARNAAYEVALEMKKTATTNAVEREIKSQLKEHLQRLLERSRRVGNVPWMRVVEDKANAPTAAKGGGQGMTLWKLRKRVYADDDDDEW